MRPEQASDYAVEHGGAAFTVCPVCNEHFPHDWLKHESFGDITVSPLALAQATAELETVLRAHVATHSPEEYLTVINRLTAEKKALERRAVNA